MLITVRSYRVKKRAGWGGGGGGAVDKKSPVNLQESVAYPVTFTKHCPQFVICLDTASHSLRNQQH